MLWARDGKASYRGVSKLGLCRVEKGLGRDVAETSLDLVA